MGVCSPSACEVDWPVYIEKSGFLASEIGPRRRLVGEVTPMNHATVVAGTILHCGCLSPYALVLRLSHDCSKVVCLLTHLLEGVGVILGVVEMP